MAEKKDTPKFWQIRATPNTPNTRRKVAAFAIKNGLSVGEALDEIAKKIRI